MDLSTAINIVNDALGEAISGPVGEVTPDGVMVTATYTDGSGLGRFFVVDEMVYRVPSSCSSPENFVEMYPTEDSRESLLVQ